MRPTLRAHEDGLAEALGCELLEDGLVRVDAVGQTTVPGVWAAGNAANARAQVISAAGEGAAVAIAINTTLINQDVAAEVERLAASAA
jgi:thioredoxin reductase